jgi:hypothetical protein
MYTEKNCTNYLSLDHKVDFGLSAKLKKDLSKQQIFFVVLQEERGDEEIPHLIR